MTPAAAFDHVGLTVRDLDAAVDFYGRALNFETELVFRLPGEVRGVMLKAPDGSRLELFEPPEPAAGVAGAMPLEALRTHGFGHFAMSTDDLDGLHDHMVAAGARSKVAPGDSPEPGVRFAFLADPEGNLVELLQRG
jgi:lactoylglutathione lyase